MWLSRFTGQDSVRGTSARAAELSAPEAEIGLPHRSSQVRLGGTAEGRAETDVSDEEPGGSPKSTRNGPSAHAHELGDVIGW